MHAEYRLARRRLLALGGATAVTGAWALVDSPSVSAASTPTKLNVVDFGAKGNGIQDEAGSVAAAIKALPAEGGELFFPPGTYLIESRLPDPYSGERQHGVLIRDRRNIVVRAERATFKQTAASAGALNGGILAFDGCTDCSIFANGIGWSKDITTSTNSSAALVCIMGPCRNIEVKGSMREGGRAFALIRSERYPGRGVNTGAAPADVRVTGVAANTVRGVLSYGAVQNITLRIDVDTVSRAVYLFGGRGFDIDLTGTNCCTSGLYLAAGPLGLSQVVCRVHLTRTNAGVRLDAEDQLVDAAAVIENVRISGAIDNEGRTGQPMVLVDGLSRPDSIIRSLDLSELTLRSHGPAGIFRVKNASRGKLVGTKYPRVDASR